MNRASGYRQVGKGLEGRPFLSVVIPAYNEEKLIRGTIRAVVTFLDGKGYLYEVIAVDDGSRDGTVKVIRDLMVEYPRLRLIENKRNRGKGYSVRRGVLSSEGEHVLFSDADLSTPIEEADRLLERIDSGFDIAIGSRSIAGSRVEVHQPWWREAMGKAFNRIVRLSAVKGIKDTQCGFKCFKRNAALDIFGRQRLDGFSFDVETLYLAGKLGYRISEVPIRWINRKESRVNPLLHPLQMLKDLLRIKLIDLKGGYEVKRGEAP